MGKRIISGSIGIFLAFFVIMAGGIYFIISSAILSIIGWKEYVNAFAKKDFKLPLIEGGISVLFLTLSYPLQKILSIKFELFSHIITLIMVYFLIKMVICHQKLKIEEIFYSIVGIFYIGGGFYYLVNLRLGFDNLSISSLSLGCIFIWLTLVGTWASDTFAYFVGSFLGKHKLCPKISPKKTVEGFIGGVVGTILAECILGSYFALPINFLVVLGIMVAIFGTLGDLVESILKRYTNIKDSGNLIPGHGGVLDRFDSLLFTAPLVYHFCIIYLNIFR